MSQTELDSPWKNVLNQFLPDFMAFCLPDVAAKIDWSRGYISLDKELNAIGRKQAVGKRISDVLFKVWLKDGEEVWLLLHVEIQGKKEAHFPARMYTYNYRIFDRYQKPIVSVAILADDNPHWHPTYYERVSPHNRLYFEFATIKLLDYADKKQHLRHQDNPFAIVVWAHLEALQTQKNPDQRLASKLAVTRALYEHGFSKDYILDLYSFIDWILALPQELELKYIQEIEQLEEEKKMNYITSAERIGWQRGWEESQHTLLNILTQQFEHRFGQLPEHYKQLLAEATPAQLSQWSTRLLDVKTLDEVFKG